MGNGNRNGNCIPGALCVNTTNSNSNGNFNTGFPQGGNGNHNGNCAGGKFLVLLYLNHCMLIVSKHSLYFLTKL